MGFLDLFIVALIPILKTLIITAVGLFLAVEKVNILNDTARHHFNNLVFFVFTPALVASSLANTITMTSLIQLWFMPVNILLTFMIGSALGWILVKITKTPQHLHGLVIGSCAAGNLGNLLLIIIPAVCDEANSPFGDSSNCSTNGQAYASLSMAIGAVFIWTYVYNIIRRCAMRSTDSTLSIRCFSENSTMMFQNGLSEALLSFKDEEIHQVEDQPVHLGKDTSVYDGGHEDDVDDKVAFVVKVKQQFKVLLASLNLKILFAPSTIATIVGLLIGVASPLRKVLVGQSAPLHVIYTSAAMLGDATIPSMTLIVGANLLKGLKKSGLGVWIIVGVQVVRFIAMPLLGILVVKFAKNFGLVGSDSLYQFVLLLQYALPSAMAIGTITQLFEAGESECSVIMLWNYAIASLALTLWSTYYMWLVS
ncbi:OLC1v1010429C1 [Oldenlandia corymbosa var. corymbosa]|uniref:OLC1v1010429C1 n=1 Tax=Oldenlandia corymbosa var. corymbosa TaxID=529605 RepID=A0AAV1DUK2_OLDCO|nr:OLC1v1010429C1 [Oldenlandia corymbosa var. corymbosa]